MPLLSSTYFLAEESVSFDARMHDRRERRHHLQSGMVGENSGRNRLHLSSVVQHNYETLHTGDQFGVRGYTIVSMLSDVDVPISSDRGVSCKAQSTMQQVHNP